MIVVQEDQMDLLIECERKGSRSFTEIDTSSSTNSLDSYRRYTRG